MKWIERLIYVLGILIIIFGFIMTAGGLINLFEFPREDSVNKLLIMIGILGIIPIIIGFIMCLKTLYRTKNKLLKNMV